MWLKRAAISCENSSGPAALSAIVAAPIPSCCAAVANTLSPAIREAFTADANFGVAYTVANVSMVEMGAGAFFCSFL